MEKFVGVENAVSFFFMIICLWSAAFNETMVTIIILLSLIHEIDTFNPQLLHARKKLNGQ